MDVSVEEVLLNKSLDEGNLKLFRSLLGGSRIPEILDIIMDPEKGYINRIHDSGPEWLLSFTVALSDYNNLIDSMEKDMEEDMEEMNLDRNFGMIQEEKGKGKGKGKNRTKEIDEFNHPDGVFYDLVQNDSNQPVAGGNDPNQGNVPPPPPPLPPPPQDNSSDDFDLDDLKNILDGGSKKLKKKKRKTRRKKSKKKSKKKKSKKK